MRELKRGEIKVGNEIINEDLVLHNDRVIPGWQVSDITRITLEDLEPHLREQTEIVLLGTGWQTHIPPRELIFAMARRRVGFEVMDTPAACRTFNILISEGRDVSAFLIIK